MVVLFRIGNGIVVSIQKVAEENRLVQAKKQAVLKLEREERAKRDAEVQSTVETLNELLGLVSTSGNPEDWSGKHQDAWENDLKIIRLDGALKGWLVKSSGPEKLGIWFK